MPHAHITSHRRSPGCVPGAGPFALGDVTQDCVFNTVDSLVTAQYNLVKDQPSREPNFVPSKLQDGLNVSITAMDVDFNGLVQVLDVQTMVFVYFGQQRFVQPITQACDEALGHVTIAVARAGVEVAQSWAPTHSIERASER